MLSMINSWRLEQRAVRQLSRLSDRELADLGIARRDIKAVARFAAAQTVDDAAAVSSPLVMTESGAELPAVTAHTYYRPTSLAA